ncbi:MAG: signal peptidase II [Candidatus Limnocylindria bacterium]
MEVSTERDASLRAVLALAGTAIVLYTADQLTKAAIVAGLPFGARQEVVGDLVMLWHVRNTGAAFSLFPGATWLFFVVTALALVMIAYFHRAFLGRSAWIHVVLGAVLAGTLGNLTDRIRFGYVVDFISVGFGETRFPTFNVADSAVVVGIGLLVLYLTFIDSRPAGDAAT